MSITGVIGNKRLVYIVACGLGQEIKAETFTDGFKVDYRVVDDEEKETEQQRDADNLYDDGTLFLVIP